ncbi:MAG: lactate utilization protein [Dehalococcoidales bacterium]|nr:lactate utilization protein [Dehalococcoidales bacterium]MDZ4230702.1 lactate utilization protein [Dehalococcoidales bacterium]
MDEDLAKLIEARGWYQETLAGRVIKALEKNNITGIFVKTKEEALEKVMSLIPEGSEVGYGGSRTLDDIGVKNALRQGNYDLIGEDVQKLGKDSAHIKRTRSLLADVFITSVNALTTDGKLVCIDGTGNRVGAIIFGPGKVVAIAGINKIVHDVDAAIRRIKDYVVPIQSRRRGHPVPCAKAGVCVDCRVMERMCNNVCIIEHQREKERITVIIVGEELGI